jgi:5-carboxymethyl-2-hydroxymuconate isomerase
MLHYVKFHGAQEKINVGKIICVGRNYADHAKELGHELPAFPVIFLKPSSVLIQSGQNVVHPNYSQNLHHEIELVVLIGSDMKSVDEKKALKGIAGYGVGLDMTLRDLQSEQIAKGNPWTLSKCFDTSAVVSEFVSHASVPNILKEEISLQVNGETRQHSSLSSMIFSPATIIAYVSERLKLEPGDLIFTGTPAGVSQVVRGDKLQGGIGNICHIETEIV